GLSTDEFNAIKLKKSYFNYEQRELLLRSIVYVDEVFPETCWEQKEKDIIEKKIDVLVMGDDWKGKFDHLRSLCEVVYSPRTPEISTSRIKRDLSEQGT